MKSRLPMLFLKLHRGFAAHSRLTLALPVLAALMFSACSSGRRDGQRVSIPRMEAKELFFDGTLAAHVVFGGMSHAPARGKAREGQVASDNEERPAGKRGARPGPGGGGRRATSGAAPGDGDSAKPAFGARGGSARAGQAPAVQLVISVTNLGQEPQQVEVEEFNSLLGNFVVQPETVTIGAGETVSYEPLTSRLGIPQGELPMTLRLRRGETDEEKTLLLRATPAAP